LVFELDPRYIEALTIQSDELLKSARVEAAPPPALPRPITNPPHPRFVFTKEHIIGDVRMFESLQDGEGTEHGRFWNSGGSRIG
jgi:hypothetical protein